jgi:hypothetical protein
MPQDQHVVFVRRAPVALLQAMSLWCLGPVMAFLTTCRRAQASPADEPVATVEFAPAPAPTGEDGPVVPTALALAPAPALAADVNGAVGAVNEVSAAVASAPRPGPPRNGAQPPALPAMPPQVRACPRPSSLPML